MIDGLDSDSMWVGQFPSLLRSPVNTAIVHIDCATDSIPEVAEALAALPGVSEVYSVAGNVDLIAIVRVPHFDDIAEVIAGRISKTPGVLNTESHIAFRAYSKHDLEDAFAIGLPAAD
jgi:DNA-binding Lrp family transcriptional regulator